MAGRAKHKLSALKVEREKRPGMYSDGGGLYLQVKSKTARSWIFRYSRPKSNGGGERYLGLGAVDTVSLEKARKRATRCREQLEEGQDPIEARDAAEAAETLAAARSMSFKAACEAYIEQHRDTWKSAKHAAQWTASLEAYVYPHIGALSVAAIDTPLVLKVLLPIWKPKDKGGLPETAGRVRGRIELVLRWAASVGYRAGENPATIEKLSLPSLGKLRKVQHHAALPYAQIGDFVADLQTQQGVAGKALLFTILTASRTTEARGAKWNEIDLAAKVWTVPAERMKGAKNSEREHMVPLSSGALTVLKQMRKQSATPGLIFRSPKGKMFSENAMLAVLNRMGRDDLTVHGFRSTFRDWAGEQTSFPAEVAEAALAHVNADKVEASYLRGTFMQKRAKLMEAWAGYCLTPSTKGDAKVISIGKR